MDIKVISEEDAKKELDKVRTVGQYQDLFEQINKDGKPRKVTDLSRGQVAALYRTAKDKGLIVKTSYKDGYVVLLKAEVKGAKQQTSK